MEGLVVLALLIPLALLVGCVLGFVAFVQLGKVRAEVAQLKQQLEKAISESAFAKTSPNPPQAASSPNEASTAVSSEPRFGPKPAVSEPRVATAPRVAEPEIKQALITQPIPTQPIADTSQRVDIGKPIELHPRTASNTSSSPVRAPSTPSPFITHLTQHWMVWLGGFCVALAGIFLAKYSIEQGLLGPAARVAMGVVTGLALHAGAVWLRAKYGAHPALAALAGGGSITLFAALLAALHFYNMFSPLTVFALLAVVALITMWLALQHGPVLAVIGMLGAYTVPVMVSTGSGNIVAAMAYALIISASVLLLLRHIKAPWLWWGLMAGGMFWWAISLTSSQPDGWRGLYLAIFAYGLIAFVDSNWRLAKSVAAGVWPFSQSFKQEASNALTQTGLNSWLAPSLLIVVAAQIISALVQGWQGQWLNWGLLAALLLWLAGKQPKYTGLVWLLFVGHWLAILLPQLYESDGQYYFELLAPQVVPALFKHLLIFTVLFVGLAFRNLALGFAKNWWAAMVAMVPVLGLLLANLLGAAFSSDWYWALLAFALGASYVGLAVTGIQKNWTQELYVWLFLAGHFAYSFAATLMLQQATLTLAIAAQIVSIAWLIRRFEVTHIGWLLKTVVVLVVVRLTLNPWLASYPADAHWPLWTFGGATLFCVVAARWLNGYQALARWAEAAALHLLVLTLWAEARYWLYDGATFHAAFTFNEAILNCLLFASLALVYHYKASVSAHMASWYRAYSVVQMGVAFINYGLLVVAPFMYASWLSTSVGETPIFNILLIAYGLPIGLAYLCYRFYLPRWRQPALVFGAVASFIFISLEIRHLWQGHIDMNTATGVGELYTYSIVWLLLAVGALLAGSWKLGKRCYQGGLMLLALVIVKIFIVDMAGLDGLLRVASFMGLGLALLAVAFLHQKLSSNLEPNNEQKSSDEIVTSQADD